MIIKPVSTGRGVAGLFSYLGDSQTTTDLQIGSDDEILFGKRVQWQETCGGTPTPDLKLCILMMRNRVTDAEILKERAGASTRGRKLTKPFAHFCASWPPGETPTRAEQRELIDRTLNALKLHDHLAFAVAHADTEHFHIHLVVCRVHPETGRAADIGRSGLRLSRVAEEWEREHGGIRIQNRVDRREAREKFSADIKTRMAEWDERHPAPDPLPVTVPQAERRARAQERRQHKAQRTETSRAARIRARWLYPLPPMQNRHERRQAGGRPHPTSIERLAWAGGYRRERAAAARTGQRQRPKRRPERLDEFRRRRTRQLVIAGWQPEDATKAISRVYPRPRRGLPARIMGAVRDLAVRVRSALGRRFGRRRQVPVLKNVSDLDNAIRSGVFRRVLKKRARLYEAEQTARNTWLNYPRSRSRSEDNRLRARYERRRRQAEQYEDRTYEITERYDRDRNISTFRDRREGRDRLRDRRRWEERNGRIDNSWLTAGVDQAPSGSGSSTQAGSGVEQPARPARVERPATSDEIRARWRKENKHLVFTEERDDGVERQARPARVERQRVVQRPAAPARSDKKKKTTTDWSVPPNPDPGPPRFHGSGEAQDVNRGPAGPSRT